MSLTQLHIYTVLFSTRVIDSEPDVFLQFQGLFFCFFALRIASDMALSVENQSAVACRLVAAGLSQPPATTTKKHVDHS